MLELLKYDVIVFLMVSICAFCVGIFGFTKCGIINNILTLVCFSIFILSFVIFGIKFAYYNLYRKWGEVNLDKIRRKKELNVKSI